MVQNLRLVGTRTLTPEDSDVSENFVLPVSAGGSWGDAANSSNAKHLYDSGNSSYGVYYNWYTATAGTGVSTMVSASNADLTNATESICPKGWELPYGGANPTKSFYALDIAYGGTGANRNDVTARNRFLASPLSFLYSGGYSYSSGVMRQGLDYYGWSRSAGTTAGHAYFFDFNTDSDGSGVFPQNEYHTIGCGFAVRCLAK